MKKNKIYFTYLAFLFLGIPMITAQVSRSNGDSFEVPGDFSGIPGEVGQNSTDKTIIPQDLLIQYENAKRMNDEYSKERIGKEIMKYIPFTDNSDAALNDRPYESRAINPPFYNDWNGTDITVYSGPIAYQGGFRQIDLKQGEDGWLYLAINKRPASGANGSLGVYRSSDGGASWIFVNGIIWESRYIQSISMLIENNSFYGIEDSTKIILYYVTSLTTNFNDARLESVIFNRTGINWDYNLVSVPAAGNKYEFPSSCSDGMYWSYSTYLYCVVREATNAGKQVGLRNFLSTAWTKNHTSTLLQTGYNDYYPSIQYVEKNTYFDTVYIAVERRFSGTDYGLRLIATPGIISSNYFTYFIANSPGVKYEKPALTVVQQNAELPRKILITCTRNRNPRFFYSTNGSLTWTTDQLMGINSSLTADYTMCNSDSLTSGGQNIIMGYVSEDGDSVNLKQLSIPPGITYNYYKKNNNFSSGSVAPSAAIYKTGMIKYAAFSYAGTGPANIYYNSEQLTSLDKPGVSNIPVDYELSQNYPNPFNPVTNISFSLLKAGNVNLVVYDILGNQVAELVNSWYDAGTFKINFDASALSTGVYFYRLKTDGFTFIRKMMLIK